MATAYKNKFATRCDVTGGWIEKGAGWVIPLPNGKWRSLTDAAMRGEGHSPAAGIDSRGGDQSRQRGVTTGKSVADCWAQVFDDNEARVERGEEPWTDERISQYMMVEFPRSSEESKSANRVRMYRGSYNRGAHTFQGRGEPKRKSREYGEDGKPVEQRAGGFGSGVSEERVREIAREEDRRVVSALQARIDELNERPVVHVSIGGKKAKAVDSRGKHARFVDVLKRVEAGVNVLLVGPAGCGKTYLAEQVASALGLNFTFNSMSEGVSEAHLLGRMLPDAKGVWRYQPSPFVCAYRDGGVHLLDEVDASDPNLMVSVNAALANGYLSLPFAQAEPVKRHRDSVIIAAANTFGNGADRQYVGRNQLDAATVDRFKMGTVEMDYDRDVERAVVEATLAPSQEGEADRWRRIGEELLSWAWATRDAVRVAKLRRFVSTRNIVDAAKLLRVGLPMPAVKAAYLSGWSDDERVRIGGAK